jgi:hypothetical protein
MGKALPVMLMAKFRRSAYVSGALCGLAIIWIFHFVSTNHQNSIISAAKTTLSSVTASSPSRVQFQDLSHLDKHELSPNFAYSQRIIRTKPFYGARDELTVMNDTKLFDEPQMLSAEPEDLKNVALKTVLPPLTLSVPTSPKVDTSIMAFGIHTNAERVPDAVPQLQHWLPNTKATLHILVPPSDKIQQEQQGMRDLGIKATIKSTNLPFAKAYFSLIKELYDTRTPQTKWLVLIDDDTFIPSLPTLIAHLNKAYDVEEDVVLAAMSDNIDQIHAFGLIPFGGGGIFISVPLAAKLTQPKIWKACMQLPNDQGDQIVDGCLRSFSSVHPTFDSGLNQMDIRGDENVMAGYFESGRQMLTIHHWRSWYNVDMPALAYVSKVCGDEGILMRWLFEGDIVLSNGYSIAEYPNGIELSDLAMVEHTWSDEKSKALHKIGPLRDKVEKGDKVTLKMVDTEIMEGYGVRQTYVHRVERVMKVTRGEDAEKLEAMGTDQVVELIWVY